MTGLRDRWQPDSKEGRRKEEQEEERKRQEEEEEGEGREEEEEKEGKGWRGNTSRESTLLTLHWISALCHSEHWGEIIMLPADTGDALF